MTPQAVIFDIGNVLIEWNPERFYDAEIGADARARMFASVDLHAMNDAVDRGANWRETVLATADAHPDFRDHILLWHDRWIEMASPVIPHSLRLLRGLRTKGIPVYALSNFGVQTFAYAETIYPFLAEFDQRYISGHMQCIKPEPEIYAAVETGSGLPPASLLFADDRPDNIYAANERGWKTHLFAGPEGWAARLVAEGLLTEEEAA